MIEATLRVGKKNSIKYTLYKGTFDMPIWNFDCLCKGGNDRDYTYLFKEDLEKFPDIDLEEHWIKIYDGYLKKYGLGDDYIAWCKMTKKATNAFKQAYVDGKKWMITHAKLYQAQADQMIKDVEHGDLAETCVALGKFQTYRIDPMVETVDSFNAIIKLAEKTALQNGK